ncbi:MAG TPA: fibrobacter succinogenes major paralogous domain-containing protein [Prolixibacteraceae bacterium]|nr:fibrobacter succinogenes major paralogous domain-containing protein [Prolixibacteraceae bacterium]
MNRKEIKQVVIGMQQWMAANLNVRTFRNGDPVRLVISKEEWAAAAEQGLPACCFFEHMQWIGRRFGKLYNWYAVNDPRGLAPEGWHIASDREWELLVEALGGRELAGTRLKSKEEWEEPGGTNQSRFSALPGCCRDRNGDFRGIEDDQHWWKSWGYWWTSTPNDIETAWCRNLHSSGSFIYRDAFYKGYGFSVRCIKD